MFDELNKIIYLRSHSRTSNKHVKQFQNIFLIIHHVHPTELFILCLNFYSNSVKNYIYMLICSYTLVSFQDFWPQFYIVVLGMTFFQVTSTFSIFFLDFDFPFLFGILFPFSIWTFFPFSIWTCFISFKFRLLLPLFQFFQLFINSFLILFHFFFNSFFIQSRSHFGFLPSFYSNYEFF